MNPRPLLLIGLSTLPLTAQEPPPLPPVIAPGAKLERLSEGFQFTEGPTPDAAGNVYFTDQPNNRILKWSIEGKLSTFKEPAGRANGLFFEPGGKLIACADENNELQAIDTKDASSTVQLKGFENKRLNGPNDVWVRPDGGLYFTDPFYKRPWWQHTAPEQSAQRVYFLAKNSSTALAVADDLQQPNGITGTADGKTLFVADIRGRQTWKYAIQPDGTLTEKTLFCAMGSDGMTIDHAGNIYLTGNGVTVFDPSGKQTGVIPVPESWTANVCFGGKDFDTLFITAMDSLYAIKTTVKGVR
jgi:gluconolactonase